VRKEGRWIERVERRVGRWEGGGGVGRFELTLDARKTR